MHAFLILRFLKQLKMPRKFIAKLEELQHTNIIQAIVFFYLFCASIICILSLYVHIKQ